MTVKQFDKKVRKYRLEKGDLSHIEKCEYSNIKSELIGHELFPGNDTRRVCIYMQDGIILINQNLHDRIHKDCSFNNYEFAMVILMNRYNCNYGKAEKMYDELYRMAKLTCIKDYRVSWGCYDKQLREGDLIKL